MAFNQGKETEVIGEGKKKIGRKSIRKAMEVARKIGVGGIGENVKGASDIYKEFYDEESESNGIFRFGMDKECEGDTDRCEINMEQVKEIGEMIGVSWVRAIDEKRVEDSNQAGTKDAGCDDVQTHC